MCYCDARSFTAQRCVAQCAALYSPPRNFWVREQQNNQCYNDLKRYRRCARLLLSAQLIYIQLFSPHPSLRSIVRIIALCPARRGSIVRSTAQCPARRVAQENALHVPCDHTARRCPALHCIANIVQRSVLAAVSPSQVKPSAAASGGTAQRSTEHCQCSNDSKRFRRCAR